MGDEWPCRGRWIISWNEAYQEMLKWGQSQNTARIMAAIGSAESSLDLSIINNTPATGDYSVGVWQINYYGSLYAERTRLFGSPCHLVNSGISGQTAAAIIILDGPRGFTNWSTYNSGAYLKYTHGFVNTPTGGGPGAQQPFTLPPVPPPGGDDWADKIRGSAGSVNRLNGTYLAYSKFLNSVRRRKVF